MGVSGEYAFVIADPAGYTALTEAHGGAEAARTVARYMELASQALTPGVRLTERVGDQVLIVSDDPRSAVTTNRTLLKGTSLFKKKVGPWRESLRRNSAAAAGRIHVIQP